MLIFRQRPVKKTISRSINKPPEPGSPIAGPLRTATSRTRSKPIR